MLLSILFLASTTPGLAFSSKPSKESQLESSVDLVKELEPFKKQQPLSNWITQLIESNHYKVLRSSDGFESKLVNVPYKEILELAPEWITWLQKKHVRVSASQNWQSFEIAEHLALPKGRPTHAKANKHVFRYSDSVKRQSYYFLKADTTSSCNSGCSPIVFSVLFRASNSDLELIPDPKMPLKKKGHKDLGSSELLSLQNSLNSLKNLYDPKLNSIQHPQELTSRSEQTWAPYKSTLVEGGAYTSYRVFEAALVLVEALKTQNLEPFAQAPSEQKKLLSYYIEHNDRIGDFFRVTNANEALALVKDIDARLKSNDIPASLKGQLERMKIILRLYPFWSLENKSSPKFIQTLKETRLATDFPGLFCRIFLDFSSRHGAPNVFRGQFKKLASTPCGSEMKSWYAILTEEAISQSAINSVKAMELPEFLKNEKSLLLKLVAKAPRGSVLGKSVGAILFANHGLQSPGTQQADIDELFLSLKETYLKRLRPGLGSLPSTRLPKVEGKAKIPSTSKRVYVFFQNWCSHCKDLLSAMGQALGADEWKSVQLVETKIQSDIPAQAYMVCLELGIAEQSCDELLGIPQTSKFENIREQLELQNIPRVIVTDKKGAIIDFDLKLAIKNPALLKKQVQWAIEASQLEASQLAR